MRSVLNLLKEGYRFTKGQWCRATAAVVTREGVGLIF